MFLFINGIYISAVGTPPSAVTVEGVSIPLAVVGHVSAANTDSSAVYSICYPDSDTLLPSLSILPLHLRSALSSMLLTACGTRGAS